MASVLLIDGFVIDFPSFSTIGVVSILSLSSRGTSILVCESDKGGGSGSGRGEVIVSGGSDKACGL